MHGKNKMRLISTVSFFALALIVALFMDLSVVSAAPATLSEYYSILDSTLTEWNSSEYTNISKEFDGATTCQAFSRYVFHKLYGHGDNLAKNQVNEFTVSSADELQTSLKEKASPGDAVRIDNHIFHLCDITSDKLVIYESNYTNGVNNVARKNEYTSYQQLISDIHSSGNMIVKIIHASENVFTNSDLSVNKVSGSDSGSETVSFTKISSIPDMKTKMANGEGLILSIPRSEMLLTKVYELDITEKTWFITIRGGDWLGTSKVDVFTDKANTITLKPNLRDWSGNVGYNFYYYLSPGKYYVRYTIQKSASSVYGYLLPASSLISASVKNGVISVKTSLPDANITYVAGKAGSEKIMDIGYYNILGTKKIKVNSNGTYTIRATTLDPDWLLPYKDFSIPDAKREFSVDVEVKVNDVPQKQSIKLSTTSKTIKYSKLKKKKQTFKLNAKITNGTGKLSFKKVSGNSKISVNGTGTVTVKAKLKKGNYNLKVKLIASAKGKYKKTEVTKTIKIKVN